VRVRRGLRRFDVPLLALALACGAQARGQDAAEPAAPRGNLLIIGGGERPASVTSLFARLAGGADAVIAVFPQASQLKQTGPELAAELGKLGAREVRVVAADRKQADGEAALRKLDGVTGVFFAGGDQARLTGTLRGTAVERRLHELYAAGAVIAGTSAGAAVMSRVMITGDERRPLSKDQAWQRIESDDVVTDAGFGFLDGAIVDQHFVRRRRNNRLLSLVLENPSLVGLGIDERTALWVRPGGMLEVVGDGPVVIYDARGADTVRLPVSHGLEGAGLRLHVLRAGAAYDLTSGRVVRLSR
jgi:cyanophycinase